MPVNVEELAGLVIATQAIVLALVFSHPDKPALLQELNSTSEGALIAMLNTVASEKALEHARSVLDQLKKLVATRIQESGG